MTTDTYETGKTLVRQMRSLIKNRDLASLTQAVQEMQDYMQAHPDDVCVGTALEEFDILAEAAQAVETRKQQAVPVS